MQTSFGQQGHVFWTDQHNFVNANNLYVYPDDKILVVGSTAYSPYPDSALVVRFNADGSIDSSFGNAGVVKQAFPGYSVAALCGGIQSDGKILAAGATKNTNAPSGIIFRLLPDGQLDTTFGNQGLKIYPHYLGKAFTNMIPLSANKWMLSGYCADDGMLFRMAENGDPDSVGLGTASWLHTFLEYNTSVVTEVVQLGDKFYGSGYNSAYGVIFCVNDSFQYHSSFGNNGLSQQYPWGASRYYSLAFTPDSAIIAVGKASDPVTSQSRMIISKYTFTGSLDTSFNAVGYALVMPPNGANPIATTILPQNDGKFIVGGLTNSQSYSNLIIYRFLNKLKKYGGPSTQSLFENNSPLVALFPNPCQNKLFLSGLPDQNRRISIKDIYGKTIRFMLSGPSSAPFSIDVSDLASGVYFVDYSGPDRQQNSLRFIKE